ncbi:tetratricopeptide repeat protein [Streptomyces sp. NPDC007856]|uniref:tetratricopeptide repeat protein n=1 Tax=Streptomyces sp. NPDC007856 TaxID=3364781 RepID=UPI003679B3FC
MKASESGITAGRDVRLRGMYVAGRDLYAPRVRVVMRRPAVFRFRMPPPPDDLPAAPGDFTGRRRELEQVRKAARRSPSSGGSPGVCVITGPPGVGKSALALRVAREISRSFPHARLYADLRGGTDRAPAEPADVLGQFLIQLGDRQLGQATSLDERAARFRAALARKRALIVLDDAAGADQIRSLLPGGSRCFVLVTSRRQLTGLAGAELVRLDAPSEEESTAFLSAQIGAARARAEPEAVAEIVALCGRLPLALRVAGARLRQRPQWPVSSLLEGLRRSDRRMAELRVDDHLDVGAVLSVGYRALDAEPARAFRLLALLEMPAFGRAAAAAVLDRDPVTTEKTLDVLLDAALLEAHTDHRYRLHDLVQIFAADRLRQEESAATAEEAFQRLLTYYRGTAEAAVGAINGEAEASAEFPDYATAMSWMRHEQHNARLLVDRCVRGEHAARLMQAAALASGVSVYLGQSFLWSEWEQTHVELLRALDASGQINADLLRRRSALLCQQHRFEEAHSLLSQARSLSHLERDAIGEARVYYETGFLYLQQGKFDEAEYAFGHALRRSRKVRNTRLVAKCMLGLGTAARNQGRLDQARECYEAAREGLQAGGDVHSLGVCWMNTGNLEVQQGRWDVAVQAYENAWELLRDFGDQSGQESVRATAMLKLGIAHLRGGSRRRGLPFVIRGLVLLRRIRKSGSGLSLMPPFGQAGATLTRTPNSK